MLKYKVQKVVNVSDWDKFVEGVYGRRYSFQQQDGCKDRGIVRFSVPLKYYNESEDEEMNDSIPEVINGNEMGVKFAVWLARDPKQPIPGQRDDWQLGLFWDRNFYPNFNTVVNDLYKRGLLEDGEYLIDIDW